MTGEGMWVSFALVGLGWWGNELANAVERLTPRGGWRSDPDECPLGGMTALGVHMVDSINYLAGGVREVYTYSRRLLGRGALDDITTLSLDLESATLATLSTSVVLPRETTIAVHGHDRSGWSELDGAQLFLQSPAERERQRRDVEPVDAVAEQFVDPPSASARASIRKPTARPVGAGRDVVVVMEAARLSVAQHRPVAIADVRDGTLSYA